MFVLTVNEVTPEAYELYKAWIRKNIPTTDSLTPEYKIHDFRDELPSLKFRFRTEEQLMAFKLILN